MPGAVRGVSIGSMVEKPVLITDAAPSLDDDLARRRRTYLRIMVVHLVGFGLSYPLYLWQWWAGALPWVAVVLANAGPRRTRSVAGARRTPEGRRS